MLRNSTRGLIRVVLFIAATTLIAACGDPVKEAKTAAQLRGTIEKALSRMEATGTVPGLETTGQVQARVQESQAVVSR